MKELRVGAVVRPTQEWWAATMDGQETQLSLEDKLIVVGLKGKAGGGQRLDEPAKDIYDLIMPGFSLIELDNTEFEVHVEDQPDILREDSVEPSEVKFGDRVADVHGWVFVVDSIQKDLETGWFTFSGRDVESEIRLSLRCGDMLVTRTTVSRMSPWV